MSISDTQSAKKYASIAEVAAAQAKMYALELENAPDYASEAQAAATAAAASSDTASQYASNAATAAASASSSANDAANSAAEAAEAAGGAINQTVRAPTGESLTALPAAASRINQFIVTGAAGDVEVMSRDSVPILDSSGKLPVSVIPAIALTEPFVVSSEAEMLALDAQPGDIAKRTDLGYSFCLAASPASTLSNWVQLTDDVLAQLGLSSGATQIGATSLSGASSTVQAELDKKPDSTDLVASTGATKIGATDDSGATTTVQGALDNLSTIIQENESKLSSLSQFVDDITSVDADNYTEGQVLLAKSANGIIGGGGVFYFTTSITATVDNLLVFAPASGSGRLIRITEIKNGKYTSWDNSNSDYNDGYIFGTSGGESTSLQGNGNRFAYNKMEISEDAVSQINGTNGATGNKVDGLHVVHTFGGEGAHGGRHAGEFTLLQGYGAGGETASDNADRNYVGMQGQVLSDSGDGGTSDTPKGAYFGSSSYAGISSAANYTSNVTACEFNTSIAAGSGTRTAYHSGIQISSEIGERGYNTDAALSISNLSGVGWGNGILFSAANGAHAFGEDSTAIKVDGSYLNYNLKAGIDFRGLGFDEAAFLTTSTQIYDGYISLLNSNATLALGSQSAAGTPTINFLSAGANVNSAQIYSTGGSASTAYQGSLVLHGSNVVVDGVLRPIADNTSALGTGSFRWSVVYSATSAINTSDERLKTFCDAELSDALLDAWATIDWRAFRFNSAISDKGEENARIHFGLGAQTLAQKFKDAGLDPDKYALFCYDTWEAKAAETTVISSGNVLLNGETPIRSNVTKEFADEFISSYKGDGEVTYAETSNEVVEVSPAVEAGDRYGIRYEEALVVEAALLRRTQKNLQAQIDAIAAKMAS